MLINLNVLNGSMTPAFSSNVYEYDVVVDNTAISLVLDIKTDDPEREVTVYGNDYLSEGENTVLIEVFNQKVITYKLHVYKEKTNDVMKTYEKTYEVETNKPVNGFIAPLIGIGCLFIIVFLYVLIFKKR